MKRGSSGKGNTEQRYIFAVCLLADSMKMTPLQVHNEMSSREKMLMLAYYNWKGKEISGASNKGARGRK